MCRAMYRPNVHFIAAQDAFKKALTVYENVVHSIALDKFALSMGQACMFLHS
jgi:ABC-type transport system involved in cytochrome c biogenesis ATPase subunit